MSSRAPRGGSIKHWSSALYGWDTAMLAAGRSPGTIRTQRHYLDRLRAVHPRNPWAVSRTQLVAFLAVKHWSPETRKSARAAVRCFYRWGYGEGLVEEDPAHALPSVRVPRAVPRPTPEHLVTVLVERDDRLGHMAMLAAWYGLRRAEIAAVHVEDLAGDELLVHGKGGKLRAVPITSPLVLAWLQGLDGWAFPNGHGGHLTPGHVGRLLSEAMPPGWTAHTLRHRCGTTAYEGTRDLLAVSELLGHSRPETTQRYVRLPSDALRAAVRAAGAVA